jgi:hypothetical protein
MSICFWAYNDSPLWISLSRWSTDNIGYWPDIETGPILLVRKQGKAVLLQVSGHTLYYLHSSGYSNNHLEGHTVNAYSVAFSAGHSRCAVVSSVRQGSLAILVKNMRRIASEKPAGCAIHLISLREFTHIYEVPCSNIRKRYMSSLQDVDLPVEMCSTSF